MEHISPLCKNSSYNFDVSKSSRTNRTVGKYSAISYGKHFSKINIEKVEFIKVMNVYAKFKVCSFKWSDWKTSCKVAHLRKLRYKRKN